MKSFPCYTLHVQGIWAPPWGPSTPSWAPTPPRPGPLHTSKGPFRAGKETGMGLFASKPPSEAPSTLFGLLERAVFALERLAGVGKGGFRAPGVGGRVPADVSYVDDAEMAILEMRRAAYEHRTGKPLGDDEEPPRIPEEKELESLFVEPGKG